MKTGTQGDILMKAFAGIFITLCVTMVCGCNPNAFVCHIEPSSRSFIAAEDGDTIKVRFKTDDWGILTIKANTSFHGWTSGAASIEAEDGKIKVSDGNLTMFYKKTGDKELTLYFHPNFSSTENDLTIYISNSYEEDSVKVRQPGSSGHEFVDISFDGLRHPANENEIITGWGPMTYINNGTDTLFVRMGVFAGAARKVGFTNDTYPEYKGNDFDVPVPDGILAEDKELTFSGEKARYSCDITYEYPFESDKMATMAFPPGDTKKIYYRMLWGIDSYEVGYRMRIRNKRTGAIFTIKGNMTSTSPDGFYLLTKETK